MKQIPLSRGLVALVDDEDYERVRAFKWYAKPCTTRKGRFYAVHSINKPEVRATVYLHRFIMCSGGRKIDHRNGDGLDNRKANLRFATDSQNSINYRRNTRWYRGVSKKKSRWIARICVDGKRVKISSHTSPEAAALAYDEAARREHGEFAVLNFPEAVGAASQERPEQHGQLALAARSEGHRVR